MRGRLAPPPPTAPHRPPPSALTTLVFPVCTAHHHRRGGRHRHELDPDRRGARALPLRQSPDRRAHPGREVLRDAFALPATSAANATEHARGHPKRAATRTAATRRHERSGTHSFPHGRGRIHQSARRAEPRAERAARPPERRKLPAARRPERNAPQAQRHDRHVWSSSLRAPGGHGNTLSGAEHQNVGAERGQRRPARPHSRAVLHLVHGSQERNRRHALLQRHHVPIFGAGQRGKPADSVLLPPQGTSTLRPSVYPPPIR